MLGWNQHFRLYFLKYKITHSIIQKILMSGVDWVLQSMFIASLTPTLNTTKWSKNQPEMESERVNMVKAFKEWPNLYVPICIYYDKIWIFLNSICSLLIHKIVYLCCVMFEKDLSGLKYNIFYSKLYLFHNHIIKYTGWSRVSV